MAGLLLAAAGVWLFWAHGPSRTAGPAAAPSRPLAASVPRSNAAPAAAPATNAPAKFPTLNTNKLAYRLFNTTNSIRQLQNNPHAILLANAFIDTDKPLGLKIPPQLQAAGDPHAYIVQARGPIDGRFRNVLLAAGAQVVSYIPNNAYLVNLSADLAGALSGNPLVQAVLPYQPYYKLQSSLLGLAVNAQPLPPGTALTLGVFAVGRGDRRDATGGAGRQNHRPATSRPSARCIACCRRRIGPRWRNRPWCSTWNRPSRAARPMICLA